MVGQPIIATVLSRMVTTDRVPPALLFSGPSGTGKTTAARILASELANADVIEIDAASKGKVDDIRQLRNMLTYSAGTSHRIVIIDEALALDTPLATPSGWTTVGQVRVGDYVFGADGVPTRVKGKTEVFYGKRCFNVTFSDGTSVIASENHKWIARRTATNHKSRVFTTGEMFEKGHRFSIPMSSGWDLPEKSLPIDPYLLGLWLGDGSKGQCIISGLSEDLEFYQSVLETKGIFSRILHTKREEPVDLLTFSSPGEGRRTVTKNPQAKSLREHPVYKNKHIPSEYLRASYSQRVELLQGLMDTDGYVNKETGYCTFVGTEVLCTDLRELLTTLGIKSSFKMVDDPRAVAGYGKVHFSPRNGIIPVGLPRKVQSVKEATQKSESMTITSIEEVESVPVQCIEVEAEDHLFLAGEGAQVTHNCQSMMSAAFNALLEALEEPPEGVIFVLVTTEPFSLPEAVRYRPIGFEFNSVTAEQIFARLKFVAEAEGIDADDSLLSLLASESQGNVRRAIMMLELAHIGEFKTAAEYRKAQGASDYAPVLLAALLSGDHGLIFENLDKVIHKVGNPSIIATEILKTFADMLILKSGGDIHKSGRALEYRKTLSSRIDSQRVLSACKLLWDLKTKIKVTDDLRGDLELALILLSDILTKNNPNAVRVKKPEQSQPMTADDMKEFTT